MLKKDEELFDLGCKGYQILLSKSGYRFTQDAVVLANVIKLNSVDLAVDLGTGSGIIPVLVAAKNKVKKIIGVEIQTVAAERANRTVQINNLQERIQIINKDMKDINLADLGKHADAVFINPPYDKDDIHILNPTETDISKREICITLRKAIEVASKLLKFGGKFYIIVKSHRLIDAVCFMREFSIEPKILTLVNTKPSKNVDSVVVEGRKNGNMGLTIKSLLVSDDKGQNTLEFIELLNGDKNE